ncbi:MAG: hypothetical protein CMO80_04950 [Verrucomicrobiales bacterium]|nr:hypothetical protein [Verrucomicrobiales bacterium]|tara:strand:+ start:3374 stop:4633 length:1260 start_codon:yes stop_codon:yes gene_type:complete
MNMSFTSQLRVRFLPVCLCIATLASSARGATNNALTLEEALRLAEKNSPILDAALAGWNAAEQRAIAAGSRPNPSFSIGTEGLSPGDRPFTNGDFLAGVSQTVRLKKPAKLKRDIAEVRREKAALEYAAARNRVRQSVSSAFAGALFTQANERLFAERIKILESNAALMKALADVGELVVADTESAHADLDHERLDYQEVIGNRTVAFKQLATAIGQPDAGFHTLNGKLEPTLALKDLQELTADLEKLPSLLAAESEGDILKLQSQLARASRIPSLNVELLYRRNQQNRRDGIDASVAIALPLFDDKKAEAKAFAEDANAAKARAQTSRQNAALEFSRIRNQLLASLNRVEHIRDELLPHQKEIVRRSELLLKAGEINQLQANTALLGETTERRHYLNALREAHLLWTRIQRFLVTRDE